MQEKMNVSKPSVHSLSVHILCLYLMLINDVKCVEWDIKPYYTHTLMLISQAYRFLNLITYHRSCRPLSIWSQTHSVQLMLRFMFIHGLQCSTNCYVVAVLVVVIIVTVNMHANCMQLCKYAHICLFLTTYIWPDLVAGNNY